MRNLKVMMAYRGTAYHGFQRQDNALTVQEVVERYVSKVLNHKCIINGCSRTDAGVHANNYCFSVLTESNIPAKGFVRGVNGELPDDISILSCEDAPLDFHARFSCRAKEYIYLIHNSESKNPILLPIWSIITDAHLTRSWCLTRLKSLSVRMISPAFARIMTESRTQSVL